MAFPVASLGRRRLASLFLATVALGALIAPATSQASSGVDVATLSAQESAMVGLLNADRTALGLSSRTGGTSSTS